MHQQNIFYQIDGRNEGYNQNSSQIDFTIDDICRREARERWIKCTEHVEGVLLQYTISNTVIGSGATLMLTGVASGVGVAILTYGAIMTGIGVYYHNTQIRKCDVEKENMIDGCS